MWYLTGAWIVCRGPRVGVEGEATYDGTAGRLSVPVEPVKRRLAGVPARTWKGGGPSFRGALEDIGQADWPARPARSSGGASNRQWPVQSWATRSGAAERLAQCPRGEAARNPVIGPVCSWLLDSSGAPGRHNVQGRK